ncbi:tyrosine-type recombinase/integrase [Micromonospora sp. MP36]|uniref:tyrosine-type recombinase/integrase n=1 Tax=unclassified Micromonospora TaxID=2617518 RepID=UPI0011D47D38|nr:tyrosine-type recombinase/integrase [Micromonospora sp. MP36]
MSAHVLRHTCAILSRDAGANLEDVQDQLGHADARTTCPLRPRRRPPRPRPGLHPRQLPRDQRRRPFPGIRHGHCGTREAIRRANPGR